MGWAGYVVVAPLFIGMLLGQQAAPPAALAEAAAAFEKGRVDEADQKLNSFLQSHPSDLRAVLLKGAVLDSLARWAEAESYYQRAMRLAPHSAQVLNNVANHYLASGDRSRARGFYLKVVAIDPRHANANLQLAQMSVEEKAGGQALLYLERLGDSAASDSSVRLLRAHALALAGRCSDAVLLLGTLEDQAGAGAALDFSVGMAFAACRRYDHAEEAFTRALKAEPGNFDALYNLGLAALDAGHTERSTGALEAALHERPEDVDCLLALARSYLAQERLVDTAALLTRARKPAPNRADVLLLLAQVTARLQFYGDAAAAYDDYLKLKPADDVARRERGFALARANESKRALTDLEWYVRKHPGDALGFYELAVAQCFDERAKAFQSLDRALALDPALVEVRYTRAVLNIEEERPAAALDDLRIVLEREPENYRVLTRLGQAYLGLHRAADAAEVLKRAVTLAPDATAALIQYRRALEELGRTQEAEAVLARLKQPGIAPNGPKPQAGLIDYLSLTAAGQRARYLANLRNEMAGNPSDLRLKIRLGRELFADGDTAKGLETFRQVRASPDPALLANSGRILLEFEQYEPAREFLEAAIAADGSLSAARLDLAITLFHLQSPEAALTELDRIPAGDRKGDYFLLRAQILDAQGKIPEAVEALNHGIHAAPTRTSLYLQATAFLLKHKLYHEAQDLLEQAARILPDERELLLAQVVTLDLLRRNMDADKLLAKIQSRWPEWERPYLLGGILLEIQLKSAEARHTLETAIALGANTPEAYYYQALAIMHAAPDDLDSAQNAIVHAMTLTSKDPYIYLLAGKISLARKEYLAAIGRLLEAIRLQPTLIPAHYALRDAYKALGDEQKSAAELEAIKHIASQSDTAEQSPFSIEDFLFTVRPPG